ncbi:MAG: tetratricopeptide repeat protein [bacterium]|nr:tetratricopeptide repeat protein [bacterium]
MKKLFALWLILACQAAWGAPLDEARALIEEREYDEARAILEGTLEQPALEAQSLLLLTRICNAREEYEDGVSYGKRAVKLLPESSQAHHAYAEALRIKMSNAGAMKAMFTVGTYKKMLHRAIELDPENVDALEEEIGFLLQAPSIAGGSKSKARDRIRNLEQIDWRRGRLMQAMLDYTENDYAATEAVYLELLEREPQDAALRMNLGYVLQRQEKYAAADRAFGLLAENDDRDVALRAVYQQARTRILGNYEPERAVTLLQRYVRELPEKHAPALPRASAAQWRMGMAYEQQQRPGEARKAYERALALDPEDKQARKALKALR